MPRTDQKVSMVAAICIAKGSRDRGVTMQEIMDETGISKSTVHRILNMPGFIRNPGFFPYRYYFDAASAIHSISATAKTTKQPTGNRKYESKVLSEPREAVFGELYGLNPINSGVIPALKQLQALFDMVDGFKRGENKLDNAAVGKVTEAVKTGQFVLETYYQFLDKFTDIDTSDPTWWENI